MIELARNLTTIFFAFVGTASGVFLMGTLDLNGQNGSEGRTNSRKMEPEVRANISELYAQHLPSPVQKAALPLDQVAEPETQNADIIYPEALDIEGEKSLVVEQLDSHQRAFEQEPIDTQWSRSVEDAFQQSVDSMTNVSFQVKEFRCRTSICMGEIDWDTASKAKAEAHVLAEFAYGVECITSVYVLDDLGEPGKGQVVFDCTEDRVNRP